MLTYPIHDTDGQPKYLYLYQCIRNDIIAGTLRPKEKLPSKRSLAQHLGVALITVANAYDLLVSEGYVFAEERRGYFVQSDAADSGHPDVTRTRIPYPRCERPVKPQTDAIEKHSADLRANRTSLRLFPAHTWNQLMRKTITQSDGLFATVPYNGLASLRRAIAMYLESSRGMTVDPEQIVIGAGTEYLYSRLAQLFGHTRVFGFEDPGYKKFAEICHYAGCESRFIPIDEQGIRMDALEESDADIIHVSPANQFPTGTRMGVERRRELLEWTYRSSKRYVVEDDYDSEFRYKGGYLSPLFVQDTQGRVIYLNTFSKTLVPSLRISYMVLPSDLLERYRSTLSFYSCTVSSFEQYTLAQFISQGYFERHINRIKTYYRKHRAHVLDALATSPLADISQVIEHNAGTHFLLDVDSALTAAQLRQAGEAIGVRLSLYSDYAATMPAQVSERTLVMNYAAIEPNQVESVIARIAGLFPECRQETDLDSKAQEGDPAPKSQAALCMS